MPDKKLHMLAYRSIGICHFRIKQIYVMMTIEQKLLLVEGNLI